jgi:hypothetical protein
VRVDGFGLIELAIILDMDLRSILKGCVRAGLSGKELLGCERGRRLTESVDDWPVNQLTAGLPGSKYRM